MNNFLLDIMVIYPPSLSSLLSVRFYGQFLLFFPFHLTTFSFFFSVHCRIIVFFRNFFNFFFHSNYRQCILFGIYFFLSLCFFFCFSFDLGVNWVHCFWRGRLIIEYFLWRAFDLISFGRRYCCCEIRVPLMNLCHSNERFFFFRWVVKYPSSLSTL